MNEQKFPQETVPLKDLLELQIGGLWGLPMGESELDVQVARVTELQANGGFDANTAVTRSITSKQLASRKLQKDDIVLEKSGGGPNQPVGRVGLVGELHNDTICSNFMLLMRPNPELINSRYLWLFLVYLHSTGQTIPLQTSSTNIRNINTPDYLNTLVPLVPIPQQEQISAAIETNLSRLDSALQELHSSKTKLRNYLRSVSHELLSGVGRESSLWRKAKLAEIAKWSSGGTPASKTNSYYGGDIPWAVIGDLNEGLVETTVQTITQLGLEKSSAKVQPAGTVMLAMYGASIGRTGIAGIPMATNQAIACARVDENLILPRYFLHFLQSQKEMFTEAGKGGAQPNISQGIIKAWPINVPPIKEQAEICELLDAAVIRTNEVSAIIDDQINQISTLRKSIFHAAFNLQNFFEESNE